jgi:hypothetical protein
MRSARIAYGKYSEVLQFATEISEFSKKYEGAGNVGIYLDSFGEIGTIRWFVDYENLASLEKVMHQIYADPDWFKKINEAKDLFIEGSFHDVVMRSL